MNNKRTHILGISCHDITRAVNLLHQQELVAFPTETVYGLGADARADKAVAAIYNVKDRPEFNPLIVHVASIADAKRYAVFDETAERLAQHYWPGPLTLVLPLQYTHNLSGLVTAGLPTVGIRVPSHPVAQTLITAFDGPIAAPSANPSSRISPTTAKHVLQELNGQIKAIIDSGPCQIGLESTIIRSMNNHIDLLRPGHITQENVESLLRLPLKRVTDEVEISAPGQLPLHYAPRSIMRLDVRHPEQDENHLGFGEIPGDLNLSPSGDLIEAAANLFSYLHRLDVQSRPIAVAPIPSKGIGYAINDRLRRASAHKTAYST